MIKLKYGNTNTFFMPGNDGGLLVDTDYAGTLPSFFKAMKGAGLRLEDVRYVTATHYHPDHSGLIGELTARGVKLLLIDSQRDHVHFSDTIFKRDSLPYQPINEADAVVISCGESRDFLCGIGIPGEIAQTPSHSPDSVSLLLDCGDFIVGDLEPYSHVGAYGENGRLTRDWELILSRRPKRIFFSHAPELVI